MACTRRTTSMLSLSMSVSLTSRNRSDPQLSPLTLHPITTHTGWCVLGKIQLWYHCQCHSTSRNLTLNSHTSSYGLNHRIWHVLEEIPVCCQCLSLPEIWPSTFTPIFIPLTTQEGMHWEKYQHAVTHFQKFWWLQCFSQDFCFLCQSFNLVKSKECWQR